MSIKKFLLFILVLLCPIVSQAETGLIFPDNTLPINDVYAFRFINPGANGLPMYGTADGGITYMWKYKPKQQTGYYVTFFMSKDDGCFDGIFDITQINNCDSSGAQAFYGAHPYPVSGTASGTTHNWEISAATTQPTDFVLTLAGTPFPVVYDVFYEQALLVEKSGTTVTYTFYPDLPNVSNSAVIKVSGTLSLPIPSAPNLFIGDAPWHQQFARDERMSGVFRNLRIIDATMTQADIVANAGSNTLVGSTAQLNVWYHRADMSPEINASGIANTSSALHNPVWVDNTKLPLLYVGPAIGALSAIYGVSATGAEIQ